MKKRELKAMSETDLKKNMKELQKELMKLRAQVARGTPPENPGKIRAIRRNIARILTFLHMKKLGGAT